MILPSLQNASEPATFNLKRIEMLRNISTETYQTSKMYSTGELQLEEHKTLHALSQCIKDLSRYDCKICLDHAISIL